MKGKSVMATIQKLREKYKVQIRKKGFSSVNKRFILLVMLGNLQEILKVKWNEMSLRIILLPQVFFS